MYNGRDKSATTYEPRAVVAALNGMQAFIKGGLPYAAWTFGELLGVLSAFLVAAAKADNLEIGAITRGGEAIDAEQERAQQERRESGDGDAIAAIDAGVDEIPNYWSRKE